MRATDFFKLSPVGVGISNILAPQPVGLGRWGYKLNLYTTLFFELFLHSLCQIYHWDLDY